MVGTYFILSIMIYGFLFCISETDGWASVVFRMVMFGMIVFSFIVLYSQQFFGLFVN